jgi:hypothetical protein
MGIARDRSIGIGFQDPEIGLPAKNHPPDIARHIGFQF